MKFYCSLFLLLFSRLSGQPALSAIPLAGTDAKVFEKIEIGITLPSALQSRIDSFINKKANNQHNPYNPDKIKITGQFISPSGRTYFRNAFYFQDYAAD